jgi:hypothetical protein
MAFGVSRYQGKGVKEEKSFHKSHSGNKVCMQLTSSKDASGEAMARKKDTGLEERVSSKTK